MVNCWFETWWSGIPCNLRCPFPMVFGKEFQTTNKKNNSYILPGAVGRTNSQTQSLILTGPWCMYLHTNAYAYTMLCTHIKYYCMLHMKPIAYDIHGLKLLYFVWSPPWHLYILLLANLLAFYLTYFLAFDLAFYLAYLLAFYLAYLLADVLAYLLAYLLVYVLAYLLAFHLAFYLAHLLAYYLANLLAFHLAFYLAYLLAYYLANLLAFYLANILALYLAYFLAFYLTFFLAFYLAYLLAFYLAYLLTFYLAYLLAPYVAYLLAWILAVEVRQGTLGVDARGWGPAGNTGRGYSRLRSGRKHWAWMVVVEVRQGTLGGDTRGWGPAGNTGRGWSWSRSGRERSGSQVAVGRGGRGEDEEEQARRKAGAEERRSGGAEGAEERKERRSGRSGRRQATDIKSNNPHLAGGEKLDMSFFNFQDWFCSSASGTFETCLLLFEWHIWQTVRGGKFGNTYKVKGGKF